MNAESLKAAIEAMPPEVQKELKSLRSAKRGLFGKATTQTIVQRHLSLLLWFRKEHQADHADLALLLHVHGISGPDGQPLTVGTVSSAISRAVRASDRASVQTQATPESISPANGAPARSKHRHTAVGGKANGQDSPMAPAPTRKPIALERLDLTPVLDAPARPPEDPEIRRADHHARLMTLLDPSTQED
jgi:hypothetical protein